MDRQVRQVFLVQMAQLGLLDYKARQDQLEPRAFLAILELQAQQVSRD
jgi:hypothetical protein